MKKAVILYDDVEVVQRVVIEPGDAAYYRKSLLAVLKRLEMAFERSQDMSDRQWINRHGAVLDDLADELKLR